MGREAIRETKPKIIMKTINDRWSMTKDNGAIKLTQNVVRTATPRNGTHTVGVKYIDKVHTWHAGYNQVAKKMLSENASEDAKTIEQMNESFELAATNLEAYLSLHE